MYSSGSDVYAVTLNQTDVKNNNNKVRWFTVAPCPRALRMCCACVIVY